MEQLELVLHGFTDKRRTQMINFSGKAPTLAVWVISLVLFLIALVAHFGLVRVGEPVATWSWIIGFALLLIACRVRGL
jgi:uncharacterized membrane protein YhaH (DUF805 family)